ncbi:MAG: class I SAM-dependent methyltransferase [Pseudomonadota bacterium]
MDEAAPIFRFFEKMSREGPGLPAFTKALFEETRERLGVPAGGAPLKAADMGSGSGASALILAEGGADVIAVDIHRPFLDSVEEEAAARGVDVATAQASMLEAPIEAGSLDLIWSEGAVFTVGFDEALAAFFPLLKPGGLCVVSDCAFFQDEVDEAVTAFWAKGYEGMRTVADNLVAAERAGWRFCKAEVLPPAAWHAFYDEADEVIETVRSDPTMADVIAEMEEEAALYRRYGDQYGYVYTVFQRP